MKSNKMLALLALSLMSVGTAYAEDPAPAANADPAPAVHYISVNADADKENYKNDGARSKGAVAIGPDAKAVATNSMAIGSGSKAYYPSTVSIGHDASAHLKDSIAIGHAAQAGNKDRKGGMIGERAIAIGHDSMGVGHDSLSMGYKSTSYDGGVAVGREAYANGYNVALGYAARAVGTQSLAIGRDSTAVQFSQAIGHGASARGSNSIALGYNAKIDAETWHKKNKAYEWETRGGEKEKRYIKNNSAIGESTGAVLIGGSSSIENSSSALLIGSKSKIADSVQLNMFGSQNTVTNSPFSVVFGNWNTVSDSRSSIFIGLSNKVNSTAQSILMGSWLKAQGNNLTLVGISSQGTASKATTLGYAAKAQAEGALALGASSIAAREKGVAGFDPMTAKPSTETSAVWKSTTGVASIGSSTMSRQLTGLAAGSEDSDAVNVAQLKALAKKAQADLAAVTGMSPEDVAALTGAGATGAQKPKTLVEQLKDKADAGAAPKGQVAKGDAGAVSGGAVFDAIEKLKKELGNGGNGGAGTITDGKGNSTSVQPGAIIVGKDGKDGKDGANGTTITNEGVVVKGKDGKDGTSTLGKDGLTVAGKDGRDGKDGANATADVKPGQVTLTGADGKDNADLTSDKLVFAGKDGKDGKASYGRDGLTITGPAGADGAPGKTIVINADTVDMGGNRVQNVADGVAPTDAVNKGQLDALREELSAGGADGLAAVKRLEEKSNRGDAMGAALAALKPVDFNPLKPNQFMAGYGNVAGYSALALGLGSYSDDGDTFVHAGLAYGGKSNLSFNAGVSIQFGEDLHYKALKGTKVVSTEGNQVTYLKNEVLDLRSTVAEQAKVIEAMRKELDALKKSN